MKDLHDIYRLPRAHTPPVFLAPMAGYTDAAMRQISHEFGGVPLAYTEMVNAYACVRDDPKTWCLLETLPDECPVVAHIFGSDPAIMAEAARKIEATGRFAGIDVNAGCPAPRVMHDGAGATLIKDPQRLHDILSAIVHAVRLPVSVKTRIGPVPGTVLVFENLAAAEEAGVSSFAVHGRFTSQGHAGTVHYDILAEVKAKAHIPILGNGNVVSPATGRLMLLETGVDALLVARGAIGNPWMLRDLRDALTQP
ncbi:MAG: tRNA-dihydrouridine synthase family protein, partial [Kiritimatiellae bacterium]|nr:tRNA-dihydrouridine synthase family protein [Kiritimatiellia bacterium]